MNRKMNPMTKVDQFQSGGEASYRVFHLKVEPSGQIHIGGVLSMSSGVSDEACRIEVIAGDCRVRVEYGGYLKSPTQDGVSAERKRFVDAFITPPGRKPFYVSFRIADGTGHFVRFPISFSANAPLSDKTNAAYFRQAGWLFQSNPPDGFSARPASFFRHLFWELRYDFWLLFRQPSRRAKLCIPIRWLTLCLRPIILKRRIWLLTDRIEFADDNAMALFMYLVANRKRIGCRPVFFLNRKSPDWTGVQAIGPVRKYTPLRYRLATLSAEWIVSSSSHGFLLNPLSSVQAGYRGLVQNLNIAFLQHGVIKDDLSPYIHRARIDLSVFVTTADRERKSIIDEASYGFNSKAVVLSGLPRHDLLENKREKIITFMPTWRLELFNSWDPKTGKGLLKDGFEQSAFFRHLQSPLTSNRLLDAAGRMGYTIQFFPHPVWQPFLNRFVFDSRVSMIPATTRYREVFARSAVCVTDWSSSVFDFAWMQKPVVYYQPDDDNHYTKGYFKYERDGFGPVTHSADELIDILIDLMERSCPVDEPYRSRADSFFAFHDHENCRRVTEAILLAKDR